MTQLGSSAAVGPVAEPSATSVEPSAQSSAQSSTIVPPATVQPAHVSDAVASAVASESGLPAVSLVLPTRDRPDMALTAIGSVLAGAVVPDEILVIDQGQSPVDLGCLTPELRGCAVRLVRCAPGLSRAANEGVRLARHGVVAFTHDDVEVDPEWLGALVGALVAAGRGHVVTGRVSATAPESAGAFAPALRDDPEPASHSGRLTHGVIRPMNVALHRDDFVAVGGYDDRLGPGTPFPGGEDHDLCRRLLTAGFVVDYVPSAIVRHRAWRRREDYLPLRWRYGVAHGAFHAKTASSDRRLAIAYVRADVGRRLRGLPAQLRNDPRRALGDLVFLAGNVVGAVGWWRAYGAVDSRTAGEARPVVPPVEQDARPMWSVMVPAYECATFLRHTLRSVLDHGIPATRMQIEVVDDHSVRDDLEAVVAPLGDRVGYVRHPENRGNVQTFNTCLALSVGQYVHILHGDDLVRPGFYEVMGRALDQHPECVAAVCRHMVIDEAGDEIVTPLPLQAEAGVADGLFERLLEGQLLQPPAVVVRREVYERIGGFDRRIHRYGEDWEMWTRVAAEGPVWYTPDVLACYRVRAGSVSDGSVRTGENMRDLRRAMAVNVETSVGRLDQARVSAAVRAGRRANAHGALRRALRAGDAGDRESARRQTSAAVRTSPTPGVLIAAVAVPLRLTLRSARRAARGSARSTMTGGRS